MNKTLPRLQFSVRHLALVTLVYAFLFAILAPLPVSVVQILVASGIVSLLVVADLLFGGNDSRPVPVAARAAWTTAKYATIFAFALAACFVIYIARSDTIVLGPSDAGPFWLDVHFAILGILSAVAFFSALAASQHYPSAVALMFLNTPGFTLATCLVFMSWYFWHLRG